MFNDWTKNKNWKARKNNGFLKVQFFNVSWKGKEKTHAIFERKSTEGVQFLIETMAKWGKDTRGANKRGWRLYNDNLECLEEVIY